MGQYNITTPNGSFTIEADRQPTQEEADDIGANFANRQNADNNVRDSIAADPSRPPLPDGTVAPTNMENAVSIALQTVIPVGASVVGRVLGGKAGQVVGGMAGSAVGNWLSQEYEIAHGSRKEVKPGELAAATIMGGSLGVLESRLPATAAATAANAVGTIGRVVALGAGEASLIAATAETIRSEVDEGRLPTFSEYAINVGPAAVLGGATAGLMSRYSTHGALITNTTAARAVQGTAALGTAAYVYNDATEKGEPNALSKSMLYASAVYGGTFLPSAIAKIGTEKIKRIGFGPNSILPEGTSDAQHAFNNEWAAHQSFNNELGRKVNEAIYKSPNPAQELANWQSVVDRKIQSSPNILSPEVKAYHEEFVKNNRKFADEILLKYPDLEQGVRDAIAADNGDYFKTVYAAHDPKALNGTDYATVASSKAFKSEIVNGLMAKGNISLAEAEKKADAIMSRMIGDVAYVYDGGADIGGGSQKTAAGSLMRKANLSQAARDFLGEVKDPGTNIANSLNAQARLIVEVDRDAAVYKSLIDSKLGSNVKTDYHTQLMIPSDQPVMHAPLKGVYVSEEMGKAYKELMNPNLLGDGPIGTSWMHISGLSKASKTLGNLPEAIMPQFLGNFAMAASSNKANPRNIIDGFRKTFLANGWTGNGLVPANAKIAVMNELREAEKLGMLRGGADVQQLSEMAGASASGNSYQKVIEKFSKIYGTPDTAMRYAIWKGNIDEITSWTPMAQRTTDRMKEIAKEAAKRTNEHFPTYEYINRRYRQLSAVGAANQFGAFEYEVMRNSFNQLSYAKKLIQEGIQNGNKEMVIAGSKRILTFSAVAGATTGMAVYGSRALYGTSEQDKNAIQRILPSYATGEANVVGSNGNGQFVHVPINYIAPQANMLNAVGQMFSGKNFTIPVKSSLFGTDLGTLGTAGIEFITNNYYGTSVPITTPNDKKALAERFVVQAFMPGAITGSLSRAFKAYNNETTKMGNVYLWQDSVSRIAGFRANRMDIVGSATMKLRDLVAPVVEEQTGYTQTLKRYLARTGSLNGLNEEELYASANNNFVKNQSDLTGIYVSMKQLQKSNPSVTDDKIIQAFKDAGVPSQLVAATIYGYKVPMKRGLAESDTEFLEGALSNPKHKDIGEIISAKAGTDDAKERALWNAYEDIEKSNQKGITPSEKLMLGLGVADGARATAIFSAMHANPDAAENLLSHWMSTGVITRDVMAQLSRLDREARN